ncbi:hypothetical protein FOMA001_g18980 [Fusarium oxysporum f. sp. matthiolae]|nr:hypothetical protein FOMA001_g18980 [Fusarium oxysporum f. sp. matthiolae]
MGSSGTAARFPDDCLPPECEYTSRDAVFKAINSWAAPRGYAFVTGRSHKEKTGRLTVTFTCDRACRPPDASIERRRKTSTRGTSCQFSVLAKQSLDKTTWTLRHRPDSRFAIHNHEPTWHQSAHPTHRTLSDNDKTTISGLTNAGVAPKDIRTYIRQKSNTIATQQDIYNRIADSKRELCEGQSTIHAFANQLDKEGFWNRMQLDSHDRVTAVLFAHPESLGYLKAYPDLLFLDCTYKTNKYGMPLLDIIGVDACQRSFCIAFAFLSGESEEDYTWALDRLRSMYELCGAALPSVILTDRCLACMNAVARCFPTAISLLCLWHANKAVLRYCQPTFTRHDQGLEARRESLNDWNEFFNCWHSIVRSADEETFDQHVKGLEERYLPQYLEEVGYIKANWLDLYKEKLVKAWVDQYPHFGNVVTSRVEGIHALLKSHLKKSTLDLFEAWRAVKHALLNQLAELRYNQAKQQSRVPIELSGVLYSAVHGWVSHEALRKVEEQRKLLLKEDLPACTGAFSRSHGLPCVHMLKTLQEQDQPLRLEHFHRHWHLSRPGSPQLLLEPRQHIDRVANNSAKLQSSIRREPSAFEVVEAAIQPRAQPTCSKCHATGHRMSSKSCPLRHTEISQRAATDVPVATPTLTAMSNPPTVAETSTIALLPATTKGLAAIESSVEAVAVTPVLRYDDPRAIYQRYTAAREDWYKAQPPGSTKTDQRYRKAMGLPLQYSKADYDWCLDWKQMTRCCETPTGSREWTKEEMMAYLDWDKSENDRLDVKVADEIVVAPFSSRRGPGEIWRACEEDSKEQQALYSAL